MCEQPYVHNVHYKSQRGNACYNLQYTNDKLFFGCLLLVSKLLVQTDTNNASKFKNLPSSTGWKKLLNMTHQFFWYHHQNRGPCTRDHSGSSGGCLYPCVASILLYYQALSLTPPWESSSAWEVILLVGLSIEIEQTNNISCFCAAVVVLLGSHSVEWEEILPMC